MALIPEISVVIPARDAAATIGYQLDALAGQSFDGAWEVIVVDDGSSDGTAEAAGQWADRLPSLRVVSSTESRGRSGALNLGTRAALGRRIAYCDADDVVSPSWLSSIVGALRDHEVATGPIDLALLNAPEIYRWRGRTGWQRLPDWLGFLPTALSCNLGMRRDLFDRLGGFDPKLAFGQDFDFVWRAQLDGATLGFAPAAVVHWRSRIEPFGYFKAHVRYGMADVQHFSSFAARGMPRRLGAGLVRIAAVFPATPLLLLPNQRYRFLAGAGIAVGHLLGSIRERVLYL
ncbi:MAG TPA: glycosyltransferase family A protein [Acidimicrobiales bacterium]|nr:glycosyltransferase family A protein [Acidimicrobiales bacterium]